MDSVLPAPKPASPSSKSSSPPRCWRSSPLPCSPGSTAPPARRPVRRPAPSPPTSPSRIRSDCARCRSIAAQATRRPSGADRRSTASPTRSSPRRKWITDDLGGEPRCGSTTNQVEYLHIVTTVTSKSSSAARCRRSRSTRWSRRRTEWAEGHGALGRQGRRPHERQGRRRHHRHRDLGRATRRRAPSPTPPAAPSSSPCRSAATRCGSTTPGFLNRDLNQKSEDNQTVVAKTISFVTMSYDRATSARVDGQHPRARPDYWSLATQKASKARNVSLDQRRQRRACCAPSPRRARRSRSSMPRRCSPSPRTPTRSSPGVRVRQSRHVQAGQHELLHADEPAGALLGRPGPEPAAGGHASASRR